MKSISTKLFLISLIIFFVFAPTIKVKAGLYVPIACDIAGALCASEGTVSGYTTAWQMNYGGGGMILQAVQALMQLADSSPALAPVHALIQKMIDKMSQGGGNAYARFLLNDQFMPYIMNHLVQGMLGTGGDNKAGNIVQNWLDYTSNARIGGGQQFTKSYYSDPSYLNMPESMRKLLEENLDGRYGKYGSDTGTQYKDVAKYNYDSDNLSGTDNPFAMSESSDLLLLLQPQNNYLGSHVLATNYQDLASERVAESAINEPLSNGGGFLNTKDGTGTDAKVIPGSLAKDIYQQQIIQTINASQNVKSWADAENFLAQMLSGKIEGYLQQKFNEVIGTMPSYTTQHIFGNY